MEHLPPVGWADVATKRDLDAHSVATKRDLDAQSVVMKQDLDVLRLELAGLRADMDHGFAMVRADMSTQKAEILGVLPDRLRAQNVVMFTTLIAGIGAVAAIARL